MYLHRIHPHVLYAKTFVQRLQICTHLKYTRKHTPESSDCRRLLLFPAPQLSLNERGFMSLPFILSALCAAFPQDQAL